MGIYRVIENSPNRITQHYKPTNPNRHLGVDLGWSYDENANRVYSNCTGVVYATLDHIPHGSEKGGGWGNYVLIKHPNGMFSRYAHLQENLPVSKGQQVSKDTVIGIMGNSGRSSARHLHFEVQTGESSNTRINPEPYLTAFIYDDGIKYEAHLEDIGWQGWKSNGERAGTTGESRRLEAIRIDAPNLIVEAEAHIQDVGWINYGVINKDTIIGTVGESKRLECLRLKITDGNGNIKAQYRLHLEGSGDTCWTDADGICTLGSVGQALRIEAIEILQK